MEVVIDPRKILKILIVLVAILAATSIAGQIYLYNGGDDRYLVSFFDLDKEWNLPTWYASSSLLFCSLLLTIISFGIKKNNSRFFYQWLFLSIIFLFLALDEAVQFHEQTITPLRNLLQAGGIFYYTWVIPAAILLFVFLFFYFKFVFHLSKKNRFLFIVAGSLYLGGALGMELASGLYTETYGKDNLIHSFLINIEEILELVGILVFIYGLLSILSTELKDLRIRVSVPENF